VLQCVAVRYSVVQCIAVQCIEVLQHTRISCNTHASTATHTHQLQHTRDNSIADPRNSSVRRMRALGFHTRGMRCNTHCNINATTHTYVHRGMRALGFHTRERRRNAHCNMHSTHAECAATHTATCTPQHTFCECGMRAHTSQCRHALTQSQSSPCCSLEYSQLQIVWHSILRLFLKTFNSVPGVPGFSWDSSFITWY